VFTVCWISIDILMKLDSTHGETVTLN